MLTELVSLEHAIAAPMTWQPIETAPKDGRAVLLCSRAYTVDLPDEPPICHPPKCHIGSWNAEGTSWTDELGRLDPGENGEVCTLTMTGTWLSGGGWFQPNEVTHWMPLPKPPEEGEGA